LQGRRLKPTDKTEAVAHIRNLLVRNDDSIFEVALIDAVVSMANIVYMSFYLVRDEKAGRSTGMPLHIFHPTPTDILKGLVVCEVESENNSLHAPVVCLLGGKNRVVSAYFTY